MSSAPAAVVSAAASARSTDAEIADLLESIRKENDLPALAGAVVSADEILGEAVVGVRKAHGKKPAILSDPFHLGSDTKAMTAIVIAKAVEEKKLAWTTTIGEAFADLPMNAAYRTVTLEDLLGMRGGFAHDPKSVSLVDLRALTTPIREQRLVYVKAALADEPELPPRTKYAYSNVSYVLAAAMAERAENASWEELVAREVWKPLGMEGAGFGAAGTPGKVDAPWAHQLVFGSVRAIPPGPGADNPLATCPAGCAHMPIGSWALFVRDQLRSFAGKGALLQPGTYEYLHSAHNKEGYFAGWQELERPWAKGPAFMHAGSNTVNYAVVWMAPGLGRAFLVMTNEGDPGDAVSGACDDAIGRLIEWSAKATH